MKMLFKIEEYLPETKQVVIRYCRKNSPKPITEYPAKAVSTHNYDVSFDSQNLVESIAQYGYEKVLRQEGQEDTLPEKVVAVTTPVTLRPLEVTFKTSVVSFVCTVN